MGSVYKKICGLKESPKLRLPAVPSIEWLAGQHLMLLNGDCRTVLKELGDESVQCVVTSPPYWGLRDYKTSGQIGLESTPDEYVTQLVEVFRHVHRVLKDEGTLWLNLGDSYGHGTSSGRKAKDLVGNPWRVAFALQADGWYLRQDIIWAKPNPMPESVTDRCTKSHEYIFLLTKSEHYYYDHEAIKEPSIDPESLRPEGRNPRNDDKFAKAFLDESRNGMARTRDGFNKLEGVSYPNRNKRDVWTVPSSAYSEHFATFPPDLIKPCVLAGTKPGDVILDPFGGSGTTGMVAIELGRKAILIELNADYAKLCAQRCAMITPGFPLAC